MHSADELRSTDFAIRLANRPVPFDALFTDFEERDRLGFVVRTPGGLTGASNITMAAVTAYYDHQRSKPVHPFIYPDYFVFHIGGLRGRHGMFDIWPDHKEVVVERDGERVLRAINDRGITRLLVEQPSAAPGQAEHVEEQTYASATARIRTALHFSSGGRVLDGDVEIAGNEVTERYVERVYDDSRDLMTSSMRELLDARQSLIADGRPVETYRRVAVAEAIASIEDERA